jgi:hypothetical protein
MSGTGLALRQFRLALLKAPGTRCVAWERGRREDSLVLQPRGQRLLMLARRRVDIRQGIEQPQSPRGGRTGPFGSVDCGS